MEVLGCLKQGGVFGEYFGGEYFGGELWECQLCAAVGDSIC